MTDPDRINANSKWKAGVGQDPARYLVDPGSVDGPNVHHPGMLRHARPYMVAGNSIFVFPVGVEGFRRVGTATLGTHKYLGDNTVDGATTHMEEARITLSGTFPGITSQDNMVECINILRGIHPDRGLALYAPGVFDMEQLVLPEDWEFSHDPEDRSHSIEYTITFVRIGEGVTVKDTPGTPPPATPIRTVGSTKGKPTNTFVVRDGARTLKAISSIVYGDAGQWTKLVDLNAGQLADWQRAEAMNELYGLPTYQLPTFRWPIGTKFRY